MKNGEMSGGEHRGPSLVVVATTHAVLFVASLVVSTALAAGQHFPSVLEPQQKSAQFFLDHASAVRFMAFFQFGAAIPLGIFAASATSRLQFLGMKVAGIQIALFGGVSASVALSLSSWIEWALSQTGVTDSAAATRVLHLMAFAAGGPGYIVPFGLLVAGISLTAGLQRFIPRWLMGLGLLIAGVAELSTMVLVCPAAGFLLPVARFGGLIWMISAGAALPKRKRAAAGQAQTQAVVIEPT